MEDLALELKRKLKNEKINKVAIVYHGDADGICSAVILTKILKEFYNVSKNNIKYYPLNESPYILTKSLIGKILNENPDCVFILDLAAHRDPQSLSKLASKGVKVYVLDHHQPFQEINLGNISLVNTTPFPPCYCLYRLYLDEYNGKEDLSWITAIGCFIDDKERLCKDVYDLVKILYPGYYLILDKISSLITSLRVFLDDTPNIALSVLLEAKNPCSLIIDKRLLELYEKVGQALLEVKKIVNSFSKNNPQNDVIFCKIENRNLAIEPLVASSLLRKFDKIVFVYSEVNDDVIFEVRVPKSTDLNIVDVLKEVFEGYVGGHPKAAGGRVSREEWYNKKEKIIELLKTF